MKKILLFLFMALMLCGNSHGQTLKSDRLFEVKMRGVSFMAVTDLDDPTFSRFTLVGKNMKYQHLTDVMDVFSGDAGQTQRFIAGVEKLGKDFPKEDGITRNVEGVVVERASKLKSGYNIRTSTGYITLLDKEFEKLKTSFLKYCEEKKISLE